jgi:hypothetical protein
MATQTLNVVSPGDFLERIQGGIAAAQTMAPNLSTDFLESVTQEIQRGQGSWNNKAQVAAAMTYTNDSLIPAINESAQAIEEARQFLEAMFKISEEREGSETEALEDQTQEVEPELEKDTQSPEAALPAGQDLDVYHPSLFDEGELALNDAFKDDLDLTNQAGDLENNQEALQTDDAAVIQILDRLEGREHLTPQEYAELEGLKGSLENSEMTDKELNEELAAANAYYQAARMAGAGR